MNDKARILSSARPWANMLSFWGGAGDIDFLNGITRCLGVGQALQ